MDETKSCEYQRTRMAQILHTTTRQLGEEEMFKRLNERYLPIISHEDHPDYAGQPNLHLDRDLEEWENMYSEMDAGRRAARAAVLARQHQRDEGAVYVDAARYAGRRNAFAAVVVSATTGKQLTASTVRARTAGQAEEAAIALATVIVASRAVILGSDVRGCVFELTGGVAVVMVLTKEGAADASDLGRQGRKATERWWPEDCAPRDVNHWWGAGRPGVQEDEPGGWYW
ncbi:hypothetical protein MRX96_040038 [Rhipicephalus microplus]